MCYAIPAKIVKIEGENADVDIAGVKKEINVRFLEDPKVGDYVMVHAGFAIEKLDKQAAKQSLELIEEMARLGGGDE